jgi:hypothetical protein
MSHSPFLSRSSSLALAAALSGALVGLAACNKPQTPANPDQAAMPLAALPLVTDAQSLPLAPPTSALSGGSSVRVARLANYDDGYYFADRAAEVSYGFGDAPPDYAFDYGGTRPWGWRSNDGYERFVEPLSEGDRYYYYEPGADRPFLVRDRDYAYGYRDGELAAVYDRQGRRLPDSDLARLADLAGRLLFRAQGLHDASARQRHVGVSQNNWRDRRAAIQSDHDEWAAARKRDTQWTAWHDRQAQADNGDQARWENERLRREAEAARLDRQLNDQRAAARETQAAHDAQTRAVALEQGRARNPAPGQGLQGQGLQGQGPQGRSPQVRGPQVQGPQVQGRGQVQQPGPQQGQAQVQPQGPQGPQQPQDQGRQGRGQAQMNQGAPKGPAPVQVQPQVQSQARPQVRARPAGPVANAAPAAEAKRQAQVQTQANANANASARQATAQAEAQRQAAGRAQQQARQQGAANVNAQAHARAVQQQAPQQAGPAVAAAAAQRQAAGRAQQQAHQQTAVAAQAQVHAKQAQAKAQQPAVVAPAANPAAADKRKRKDAETQGQKPQP